MVDRNPIRYIQAWRGPVTAWWIVGFFAIALNLGTYLGQWLEVWLWAVRGVCILLFLAMMFSHVFAMQGDSAAAE